MAEPVTFGEAARLLGYKSRGQLYKLKDSGRLDGYLAPGGGIDMHPPGLPPLAQHLALVLNTRGKASAVSSNGGGDLARKRMAVETALVFERHRRAKLTNDREQANLIEVSKLAPIVFGVFSAATDRFRQLPLSLAAQAVAHGMPREREFELRETFAAVIDEALEAFRLEDKVPLR